MASGSRITPYVDGRANVQFCRQGADKYMPCMLALDSAALHNSRPPLVFKGAKVLETFWPTHFLKCKHARASACSHTHTHTCART